MIEPEEISEILTEEQVEFVSNDDEHDKRWLIIHSLGVIELELSSTGEHLRFRTGPIADPTGLSHQERGELYRRAMQANERLMIGRFCGTDQIDFEIGMAFPGKASLSREQLMLGIRTVAAIACTRERAFEESCAP